MEEKSMQSLGGRARAKALSKEERSEIAREAAAARWKIRRALWGRSESPLRVGEIEIPCYVLEDGTRVLSGRGAQGALGLGQGHGAIMRQFLDHPSLIPFVDKDLAMALASPIRFVRPGRGGIMAMGYEATILTDICDAILEAREAGALKGKTQLLVAKRCEILARAFAKVGIIALVDEATGYQEVRDKLALQKILELYISKELLKWAKRFPDDFYQEMFRLKGWQWQGMKVNRPQVVGHYTNDVVYQRLAPGVLDELRRLNPPDDKGNRANRFHQWLTPDVGHPKLRDHLNGVIALMKAARDWEDFKKMVNRVYPRVGKTIEMDLG